MTQDTLDERERFFWYGYFATQAKPAQVINPKKFQPYEYKRVEPRALELVA